MKESIPQPPGLSLQVENYFTNWYRISALDSDDNVNYVTEHTGDSIIFTCLSPETFKALLKIHTGFAIYPDFLDVQVDEEKQTFTFKDKS